MVKNRSSPTSVIVCLSLELSLFNLGSPKADLQGRALKVIWEMQEVPGGVWGSEQRREDSKTMVQHGTALPEGICLEPWGARTSVLPCSRGEGTIPLVFGGRLLLLLLLLSRFSRVRLCVTP